LHGTDAGSESKGHLLRGGHCVFYTVRPFNGLQEPRSLTNSVILRIPTLSHGLSGRKAAWIRVSLDRCGIAWQGTARPIY